MRITYKMIKDLEPCLNRWNNFIEHYPYFSGDLNEFLALEAITFTDKTWVLKGLIPLADLWCMEGDNRESNNNLYLSALANLVEKYHLTKEKELPND